MLDPFGRSIDYLRVSVTDRCDFRCVYCMSEQMSFLPKSDILSLEELERLIGAFVRKGTRKIRLTGGEPLVRRDIMSLIRRLGAGLHDGTLDELTLTTNGSQLTRFATELADAGIRRINVSLDTLDADRFTALTRWGRLDRVLDGIAAAKAAGLAIKINTVALADTDDAEYDRLIAWCGEQGFDFTLIEVMPMGDIGEGIRLDQHMPLDRVEGRLARRWTLRPVAYRTGGPARYVQVAETGGRLGFITPLSHNFCESCNRIRITCTGRLYMCLGQEDSADLRAPMRTSEGDGLLESAIDEAIGRKPRGHDFVINRDRNGPAVPRHMSVTGG